MGLLAEYAFLFAVVVALDFILDKECICFPPPWSSPPCMEQRVAAKSVVSTVLLYGSSFGWAARAGSSLAVLLMNP